MSLPASFRRVSNHCQPFGGCGDIGSILDSLATSRSLCETSPIRGAWSMKLSEIAQKLACRLEGPPETEIRGIAGIEHAEAGQITFLANRRYFPLLKTTKASAVLIEEGISLERGAGQSAIAALPTAN